MKTKTIDLNLVRDAAGLTVIVALLSAVALWPGGA